MHYVGSLAMQDDVSMVVFLVVSLSGNSLGEISSVTVCMYDKSLTAE